MDNYKRVTVDGDTLVKVVGFPVPDCSPVGSEAMWVKIVKGGENDGEGVLYNNPVFCVEARFGDLIKFSGGTDLLKPSFEKTIERGYE